MANPCPVGGLLEFDISGMLELWPGGKELLCKKQVLRQVQEWIDTAGLKLHPLKTWIVDAAQPGRSDFLGYHFERNQRWPRPKSQDKLKDKIRAQTKRTNGHSLRVIISWVNRVTVGWFEYLQHSHRPSPA